LLAALTNYRPSLKGRVDLAFQRLVYNFGPFPLSKTLAIASANKEEAHAVATILKSIMNFGEI